MEHILSLSYGKDSMACLGAIELLGWPLDRIVTADVWATDTIPADLPPMVEFKDRADEIIKRRWGITVEHVCAIKNGEKRTYGERLYTPYHHKTTSKVKKTGMDGIYGFPSRAKLWCNSQLKASALDKAKKKCVSYLGIAADEPERIAKHKDKHNVRLPLVEAGWTEADCRKWCEDNGMLSPIYTTAARGGCWFCHNQSVNQLRLLRRNYPEYWALMLKWDKDSPVTFHPDGRTVHDFDRRFALEDCGQIMEGDTRFRWDCIDQESLFLMDCAGR